MENKKFKKLQTLCTCALLIALATALSLIKIWNMPWGGSVTLLSMLPIALISIRYGVKQGLFSSFIYALIQLIFGITLDGLLGWGLTAGMLCACIFLDYIAAFTVIGFAGVFSKRGMTGVISGTVISIVLRFICHVLSGVFVFASAGKLWEGFETENTLLYSLVYNGAYMLPEIILTTVGAIFVYKALFKVSK